MRLPYLKETQEKTQQQIVRFGGIRYGTGAREGELLESEGLSSAQYPFLGQRDGRKQAGKYAAATGLYARGKLCVVDGTDFMYDGASVGKVTAGEKQFATINTKIVIFPDKAYYDTEKKEFGSLEAVYTAYARTLTFTDSTVTVPEEAYVAKKSKDVTLEKLTAATALTVGTGVTVNKDSGALSLTGTAQKLPSALLAGDLLQIGCAATEYQRVKSAAVQSGGTYQVEAELFATSLHKYPEFTTAFTKGEAVEFSGCTSFEKNNKTPIIRAISGRTMTFYEGTFTAGAEAGLVSIARKVPSLTCLCECDNRIWGAEGTTIWASALGDAKSFHVHDGLSTDSYAVAVGTDGDFTGCIAYGSNVLFWKENCVHKVLGTSPKNYELYTYTVQGLQTGSGKSMAIINETLFYKGSGGVYAYNGGVPELISDCFGQRRYGGAVAGTDGQRYYISMREAQSEAWSLFVYDTLRGVWLREDATHAADFAFVGGVLHYLDSAAGTVMQVGQGDQAHIPWSATLCPFDERAHGRKAYSKLYLRAELAIGAWVQVDISCDAGPFRQVFLCHNERARTATIPILPTRCDSFTVRLSGKGTCTIRSLVREFSIGSEV